MFYGVSSNTMSGSTFGVSNGMANSALSFATVTDIRDTDIRVQPQVLLNNMNGWGLVDKQRALYPFVSDGYIEERATQHKYNLINPADTDAAFRLTFIGGWTHSSNGAQSNGSTGTANTHLNPSINLTLNSAHVSFYDRLDKVSNGWDVGAGDNVGTDVFEIVRFTGNLYYAVNSAQILASSGGNPKGSYIASRTAAGQMQIFYNLTTKNTSATASGSLPNANVYYASYGGGGFFSQMQLAFATIGSGLSSTEANNLYNIIQDFQTSLSRNV